ncbi:Na+/H+ antiporter NhaC family protein [Alkalihalobacillus sp. AL-G]|uniref:Na+/H+ antiporter NhaC family protein n=1 Tax=Alkalihalobacillus sp. AL-G TaxID=2926399 RepID=UPI00272D70D1|nr:Na+/H+ antiporter NhaC family protein [Alkalihalobacillus sp. AL-G]WLD95284.1 sodium:proton antiporter [Alkalihalobacillus sp. AL-G]
MDADWLSLVPFLVVIPIAIFTKQVLPGIFIGLIVGSYIINPSLIGGVETMLTYLVTALVDKNNIKIIVFLYVFSGLVGMIKVAGGIKGFVEAASERVDTKKEAILLTYVSTIGTFSAPSFRFVTIGPIMRALLKRVNMTKKELAFVIETTTTPIIVLIPIATAFVGYMVSVIELGLHNQKIEGDPYSLFIQSIPFNFFAIVIFLVGLYLSFFHRSSDGDQKQESPKKEEEDDDWHNCDPAVSLDLPSKPFNLLIPLFLVIALTLVLTWWDGHQKGFGLFKAFIKANVLDAMVIALLITTFLTFVFFLFQRFELKMMIDSFVFGGNNLMAVILLLSIIWGLASVTEDLGFSTFITEHAGWIPPLFVPPILFLFGSAVAYFIGSAWGTWGILMPLGISMAALADVSLPLVIGAVFASGTFGSFASPLSDDTNTISRILNLQVMEYARFKLKAALIAVGISSILYGAITFVL